MSIAGVIAATLRQEAPYAAEIQMGARLILDFQGARTGGRPYYWYRGTRYTSPEKIPGWTFARASAAIAETRSGALVQFAPGVPAITDRGLSVWESRTNKVATWSANPTEAVGFVGNPFNMSKSGDAAAVLSVVDDTAALAAAGLAGICTSGKVYKFDNSAGAGLAFVGINNVTGNLNTHVASAYVRGGAGAIGLAQAGRVAFDASVSYARREGLQVPDATGRVFSLVVNAGAIIYFILPQLEEGAFVTPPIVTEGAAATRAADNAFITALGSILAPPFTMLAWADMPAADGVTRWQASASDGTSGNLCQLARSSANQMVSQQVVSAVLTAGASVAGFSGARIVKSAVRNRAGSFRSAYDGVLTSETANIAPALSRLDLGVRVSLSSGHLNGYFQRGAICGDVSDDQLTRLAA